VAAAGEVRYVTRHWTTPGTARRAGTRRAGEVSALAALTSLTSLTSLAALTVAALTVAALTVAGLASLAGCSSAPAAGATGTSCGTTRTAANVLVDIRVAKGTVNCAAVMRAEQGYAAMITHGQVRGNGGGAPVSVDGWTCEGYATPVAIRTGDTSECHTATAEVVAVLVLPSSPPASAG
jgi:putative hemolysin